MLSWDFLSAVVKYSDRSKLKEKGLFHLTGQGTFHPDGKAKAKSLNQPFTLQPQPGSRELLVNVST